MYVLGGERGIKREREEGQGGKGRRREYRKQSNIYYSVALHTVSKYPLDITEY